MLKRMKTAIFLQIPSLCRRALRPQSSDHTLDVFFRNLQNTQWFSTQLARK